jgi:rhodanese-related sulfurtransferase
VRVPELGSASAGPGGCRSYLIGCPQSCAAALIDPELSQIDGYVALAAHHGLRIRHVMDTHTHADHFSATRELASRLDVPITMHRSSTAPFVDMRVGDGESIVLGQRSQPFMSLAELKARIDAHDVDLIVLDVRERDAYLAGHVPGARLLPRGQLELRVNEELPDPTVRILAVCEFGRVSTLAAATLRQIGFQRAIALDGGMKGLARGWLSARDPLTLGNT